MHLWPKCYRSSQQKQSPFSRQDCASAAVSCQKRDGFVVPGGLELGSCHGAKLVLGERARVQVVFIGLGQEKEFLGCGL